MYEAKLFAGSAIFRQKDAAKKIEVGTELPADIDCLVVEVAREVVAPKCAKCKTSEESSVVVGVTQPQLWSREWRGTSVATHYSLF
jgi:hypothetical protein